jgi:hypothetical protein
LRSRLGIVADAPDGEACDVALTVYDERGEVGQKAHRLVPGGSVDIDAADLAPHHAAGDPQRLWYIARAPRPDITGCTVTRHERSGVTTGEHSF